MSTKVYLKDARGREHAVLLDHVAGTLKWADTGMPVSLDTIQRQYAVPNEPWAHAASLNINPEAPGHKKGLKRLVKVQLGLSCNFNCGYCVQDVSNTPAEAPKKKVIPIVAQAARKDDVTRFLEALPSWLEADASIRFELWGGEPFVYWKLFRPLAEGADCALPERLCGHRE